MTPPDQPSPASARTMPVVPNVRGKTRARWNIPTLLTWLRVASIPLILGVFFLPDAWLSMHERNVTATTLFVLAALTDWLDGFLARRLGQISRFGAFLDPVADKLVVCSAMILLVHLGRTHALWALIIIGREIAISAMREWMAQIGQSRRVRVSLIGKFKTMSQLIAIPMLLYHDDLLGFNVQSMGNWLMALAALLTVISMLMYFRAASLSTLRARAVLRRGQQEELPDAD